MNGYKNITVIGRQSLTDIAIQEYGHIDGAFVLLQDNAALADLSDVPEAGTKLLIRVPVPSFNSSNQIVANVLNEAGVEVVSGATPPAEVDTLYVAEDYWNNDYTY